MFEFEKLIVYSKAKSFNSEIYSLLSNSSSMDRVGRDQLRRASFSIMLNIAEGSGRYTQGAKRNHYSIARGSVFECAAILDYLKDQELISAVEFQKLYDLCDEMSRMLVTMIKNLQ